MRVCCIYKWHDDDDDDDDDDDNDDDDDVHRTKLFGPYQGNKIQTI